MRLSALRWVAGCLLGAMATRLPSVFSFGTFGYQGLLERITLGLALPDDSKNSSDTCCT
jgi:hypothetical protein